MQEIYLTGILEELQKNNKLLAQLVKFAGGNLEEASFSILNVEEKPYHSPFQQVPGGFISNIEIKPAPAQPEPAYDWWRLENGQYAKIWKTLLTGEIRGAKGQLITLEVWNPYNLKHVSKDFTPANYQLDLKNRKSSVEDKGWPEWTR